MTHPVQVACAMAHMHMQAVSDLFGTLTIIAAIVAVVFAVALSRSLKGFDSFAHMVRVSNPSCAYVNTARRLRRGLRIALGALATLWFTTLLAGWTASWLSTLY